VTVNIREGDCREVMAGMPEASFDAVVTDPPYGLEFMGKEWDRLSNDVVSKSWDTKGRSMTGQPQRDPNSPGGRSGAVISKHPNPRCDHYSRAINGRDTAKGFKVCHCENPAPRLTNVYAVKMQAWHEQWAREAYRVLKPGGHIVAFGGTRTFHRLTCAIEDAGFEIRDCLSWLYGSGFPKSLDVSKAIDKAAGAKREVVGYYESPEGTTGWEGQASRSIYSGPSQHENGALRPLTAPATDAARQWQGFGTALKPAWEPIILARKPLSEPNVAANVLRHGTGAINVDGCRIATDWDTDPTRRGWQGRHAPNGGMFVQGISADLSLPNNLGRWPANVCLDEESARLLDEQSGELHSQDPATRVNRSGSQSTTNTYGTYEARSTVMHGDTGGASRFFYTAKASTSERNERVKQIGERNSHPTVKPVDLMRWLCRLITPPGGHILDPFVGSGTTLVAAMQEGFSATGIEASAEYVKLAQARIDGVQLGGLFDLAYKS
jgi:DNA modification methylase